jgi:MarR-like DNA-binding transcriptional regulator SgrR of sgrS sRNA
MCHHKRAFGESQQLTRQILQQEQQTREDSRRVARAVASSRKEKQTTTGVERSISCHQENKQDILQSVYKRKGENLPRQPTQGLRRKETISLSPICSGEDSSYKPIISHCNIFKGQKQKMDD